jgi:hypothetical protein
MLCSHRFPFRLQGVEEPLTKTERERKMMEVTVGSIFIEFLGINHWDFCPKPGQAIR